MREIVINMPDDFHHHLRDGEVLKDTVGYICKQFQRAVGERDEKHDHEPINI